MTSLPLLLIAEDDPDARDYYALALKDLFELRFAHDGLTAWRLLMEDRPRLLLTDLNMPGLDGMELVRRVRAEPSLAGLPVIVLTGTTVGSDLPPNFWKVAIDADLIMEKPVVPESLRQALQRLLAPRPRGGGAPPPVVEYKREAPVRKKE